MKKNILFLLYLCIFSLFISQNLYSQSGWNWQNTKPTLVNEELKPGSYEYEWDGSKYSSGIYFYKLQTKDFSQTKKLVLIK